MPEIVCYLPTYSPTTEADISYPRPYSRLTGDQIASRASNSYSRLKPWVYMDAIDSILNTRPDIKLIVADGKSTDSIREELKKHHHEAHLETCEATLHDQRPVPAEYILELYPEKMSQWVIFNDIVKKYTTPDTKYFVYSSSDVIWAHDWVAEAIKAFEKDPKLQILFPTVSNGDPNLPCQIATGPQDMDPILPPYQQAARAPVLNAYAMIFRMDFLRAYGGYPDAFRNCFTESFLAYMCEAVGGEMRLLPRGWVYHHGAVDIWADTDKSYYYYNEEKLKFEEVMNSVLIFKAMNQMTKEMLKQKLYK